MVFRGAWFLGEHGWRSRYAPASHLSDPGSIPVLAVSCGFTLLFVLAFLRGFFSGFFGFPPSNSIWTSGPPWITVLPALISIVVII